MNWEWASKAVIIIPVTVFVVVLDDVVPLGIGSDYAIEFCFEFIEVVIEADLLAIACACTLLETSFSTGDIVERLHWVEVEPAEAGSLRRRDRTRVLQIWLGPVEVESFIVCSHVLQVLDLL